MSVFVNTYIFFGYSLISLFKKSQDMEKLIAYNANALFELPGHYSDGGRCLLKYLYYENTEVPMAEFDNEAYGEGLPVYSVRFVQSLKNFEKSVTNDKTLTTNILTCQTNDLL